VKKSLVIVESPSKAKTINKFLGNDFLVKATVGHIKNLPESTLGVNIDEGYVPEYVTIPKQKRVVRDLKKIAETSGDIYIATDPDREGEAIAHHISLEIGTGKHTVHRAFFNEITRNAVTEAIKNPLSIDNQKVEAQQARRVMDRIVGYMVSPILWRAIYKGSLSAGRVQSVALRLVCEREEEIKAFVQEEYWTIHVLLETPEKQAIKARLTKIDGKKAEIPDEKTAQEIVDGFKSESFVVGSIEKKKVKRHPAPPFITSTLQQEASNRIGFSPSRTMAVAQQLYEGIELGGEGSVSLITYMRTDSTRISKEALQGIRGYIAEKYGNEFVPAKPRAYKSKSKGKVQDAHESIRPTYLDRPPESVQPFLKPEQFKLYQLIWNRAVACQMTDALYNQTGVNINAGKYEFRAAGRTLLFPGFLRVWQDVPKNGNNNAKNHGEDAEEFIVIPPEIKKDMNLGCIEEHPEQHFTQPPPRFSESSLVKELDQLGIGRPSTYALTISTIYNRKYVSRNKKRLAPTELGILVNKIVVEHFSDIFNVNFTALMETQLDQIESGKKEYIKVLDNFYGPFQKNLEKVKNEVKSIKKAIEEKAGFTCDKCGKDMVVKWSKYGKFFACSGFPECKNTVESKDRIKEEPEKAGFKCEKCGADMVVRSGRYGKFYACSAYPKCKNTVMINGAGSKKAPPEKAGFKCEKCGADMVVRTGRYGKFYACSGYPKCKNIVHAKKDKKTESKKS